MAEMTARAMPTVVVQTQGVQLEKKTLGDVGRADPGRSAAPNRRPHVRHRRCVNTELGGELRARPVQEAVPVEAIDQVLDYRRVGRAGLQTHRTQQRLAVGLGVGHARLPRQRSALPRRRAPRPSTPGNGSARRPGRSGIHRAPDVPAPHWRTTRPRPPAAWPVRQHQHLAERDEGRRNLQAQPGGHGQFKCDRHCRTSMARRRRTSYSRVRSKNRASPQPWRSSTAPRSDENAMCTTGARIKLYSRR